MKQYKRYLIGGVISLTACVASAARMGAAPLLTSVEGAFVILSITAFFACVSRWLAHGFALKTGVALSEYAQWLYGGR